jgi:hypothetical protein
MADFFRPEVRQFFWRWREVLLAGVVIVLGLWWALGGVGITVGLGYIFVLIGIGWAVAGLQRTRFAQDGEGPGVVQITERRLAYFGPLDGGVIDVEDLTMLELDPASHPEPSWVLTGVGGQRIAIPINAAGSEGLFDVFAALPGIKTEIVLDVLSRTPNARIIVWSKIKPLLH